MQQIRHRKVTVDGFDLFSQMAEPIQAPAHSLLPDLPISGHLSRALARRYSERFHVAAPDRLQLGKSGMHDRSKVGDTFKKLAREIGRFAEGIGRGRFASTIRGITFGDVSITNSHASQSAICLENTRLHHDLQGIQVGAFRHLDSENIGIVTWDLDDRITYANQAFLRILGHDRESFVLDGMRLTDLTPLDWRNADEQSLTDLKRIGVALPYEKEILGKDGIRVPVLVTNINLYDAAGQRLAFVVDLTGRRRAEEAARESERRCRETKLELARVNRVAITGQLSASIVHEVSQPIAGAVTNAQVALRRLSAEPLNVDDVRKALNRMVRDGKRAADVIHRIRALINKAAPRRESLQINEAILEVVALTRGEVVKNGVSLRTQLADNLPTIQGDLVQLQQVMLNLIVNAVEAMSTSGNELRDLRISTARIRSDALMVTVQDSGPGVDSADLVRVFQNFYTTKSKGAGMGLSICRAIVESHGGRLWVSTCEPQGANFQFTLPICPDEAYVVSGETFLADIVPARTQVWARELGVWLSGIQHRRAPFRGTPSRTRQCTSG